MEDKFEERTEQMVSSEVDRLRASAEAHKKELKEFWITFATTGVIIVTIVAFIARGGLGWFVSNTKVGGTSVSISAAGQMDFALATVGKKEQGVYDSLFKLSYDLIQEKIGGTDYYIASGNSSFRVDSDKNLNNYLANADLRPGNRGNFDLYVIRHTNKSEMVLRPIFSAWYEPDSGDVYKDAFSDENPNRKTAAEFLKGHILLFAKMDEKGMYSDNIDLTENISISFFDNTASASQVKKGETNTFEWGKCVASEESTKVYRFPIYWVWPEQFGNFIYTGNSYNKNLFENKQSEDYRYFISQMKDAQGYKNFFFIEEGSERPDINSIISGNNYQTATKNYELYSDWYNAADEEIGMYISYIELGFEIVEDNS